MDGHWMDWDACMVMSYILSRVLRFDLAGVKAGFLYADLVVRDVLMRN